MMNEIQRREDSLFGRISALIEDARKRIVATVNIAEVYTKYSIGQYIVEDEQKGEYRAQYGKQILQNLSARLTDRFGDGWSYSNLRQIRQFYTVYGNLTNAVCQFDGKNDKQCLSISDSAIDANIYASAYQLYLPDKAVLQQKLKEWIDEFDEQQGSENK